MNNKFSLSLFALAILAAGQLSAGVVFTLPTSAMIQLPAINYFGPGPQSFNGVDWSSTNATNQGGSVYGYTGAYGFLGNGVWTGALGPMAGLNDSFDTWGVTDTMTFHFATPVALIGGFMNYVPNGSTPTTIAVYDSANVLIESYNLTFLTGNLPNAGQTIGFSETTADISYFTMTGNYIGIAGVRGTDVATPEPGSMMLLGTGLLAAISFGRRRFSR